MADNMDKRSQKAIDDTSIYIQDTLLSVSAKIGESLRNAVNEAFDGVDATVLKTVGNDLTRAFKSSAKFSDDVASNQAKIKQGVLGTKDVQKQLDALAVKRSALARKVMLARKLGAEINLEDLKASKEALDIQEEQIKNDKKRTQAIDKNMGATGEIFKRLAGNKFFGSILNADEGLKSMREEAAKGTTGFKLMGKGISSAFKNLEKGTIALVALGALVKVLKFVVSLFVSAQERTIAIAKQLNISRDAAENIRKDFVKIASSSDNILVNSKSLVEAQGSLLNTLGASVKFSGELLESQVFLTKNLGLSGEAAASFNIMLSATGKSADEVHKNIIGLNTEFALSNGYAVPFSSIMNEISKTSSEVAGYFGFSAESMARGVLQVRKFGLNLEQATSVAKSLLDFESSIGSELEAELLTGKEFNFERARTLAVTGDVSGATQEVLKQMQSLTKEQRKSPIIMQSIAKSTGLSVSEINKAFLTQERLNMQTKQYNELLARGGKIGQQNAVEQLALEGATYEEIKKTLTIQESYGAALEKAKDQFTGLVNSGALNQLVDVIIQLTNKTGSFLGVDTVSATQKQKQLEVASNRTATDFAKMGISAQEYQDLVEKATLNKGAFGLTSDTAFATNAGIEEARVRLRELESKLPSNNQMNVNDFTIRSNPKDTLVMAGGTRFGEETNTLLKELIAAVKEGGDVFIDGNKAGMALNLGAYRSD